MKGVVEVLERESALLDALHVVMRYLQRLLVAGDFEGVNRLVTQTRSLQRSVERCEERRLECCQELLAAQGREALNAGAVSGRELVALVPAKVRGRVKGALTSMATKMVHIQMLSESIKRFSARASGALQEIISELYPEGRHYTREGTYTGSRQTALLCNEER